MSMDEELKKLRETIADIVDEAIDMHSDTALCGERSEYAGNIPYDQTDAIMGIIEGEKKAAVEQERRENIGDKYDRIKAICEKNGYEKALRDIKEKNRRLVALQSEGKEG